MSELKELIEARWEDLQELHRTYVQEGNETFRPIVESYRDERIVAALFPPPEHKELTYALKLAPSFDSTAVVAVLDINFRISVVGEEGTTQSEDAIFIIASKGDGIYEANLYPYHIGEERELWYFDELNTGDDGFVDGRLIEAIDTGFDVARALKAQLGMLPDSDLSEFERRVLTDCSVAKAAIIEGIEVCLFSEAGSEEIIEESFKDFIPDEYKQPPSDPTMN